RSGQLIGGFGKHTHRTAYTRPAKLGKPFRLIRLGIGQAECIARATVERVLEMDHLGAFLVRVTLLEVLLHLPVHRYLKRIFHRQRTPRNKKSMGEVVRYRDPSE